MAKHYSSTRHKSIVKKNAIGLLQFNVKVNMVRLSFAFKEKMGNNFVGLSLPGQVAK